MSPRPTTIDLFAGCGGLSLGLEQAGFDVVASLEYDPVHAATHEFNFPLTASICADIQAVETDTLRDAVREGARRHGNRSSAARRGEVDVVVGGPPCQGFSTIGKRLIDDKRNRLVFHFFRAVADLRPKYFVMENVPGMRAGGHAGILTRLVEEFERIGYQVPKPKILNAADYGVPQSRTRLFVLGAREDQAPVKHPGLRVRPVAKRLGEKRVDADLPDGPTVWDAIGDLPDLDTFDELEKTDEVRLSAAQLRDSERSSSEYARLLRGLQTDTGDLSHPRAGDPRLLTSSPRTRHTELSISRFDATPPGETEPVSRFYRLPPEGLCNTLRAGTGSERGAYTSPRPIHPTLPRVISVREAARLHSFPDWFRLHATKWHGFRQVGNAVAPLVGRAVGDEIRASLGVAATRPDSAVELGPVGLLRMAMAEATDFYGADPDQVPPPRKRRTESVAA